ncbi:hypothetical protein [Shinella zoogloeoides]|uniref:hypothetical protein n=1 Tax=Shinella zoogloeoides TaxID=352475 RepID=UPI00299E5263|nr:hypothetical protein [Shinella zoogloeoides]WPE22494.1 hypothetical protein ShzoTeo12_37100 [Shinella zoogloeoides]
MTNVLLSKNYKSQKAGKMLTGLPVSEAKAIERLGLGSIIKDDTPAAEKTVKKAEKPSD